MSSGDGEGGEVMVAAFKYMPPRVTSAMSATYQEVGDSIRETIDKAWAEEVGLYGWATRTAEAVKATTCPRCLESAAKISDGRYTQIACRCGHRAHYTEGEPDTLSGPSASRGPRPVDSAAERVSTVSGSGNTAHVDTVARTDGNEDCPRCGGRRLVLLDTVEHVGPCETADDVSPNLTARHAWAGHGHEVTFIASGRGAEAKHPTYDGAIAAWREKLRERGMR